MARDRIIRASVSIIGMRLQAAITADGTARTLVNQHDAMFCASIPVKALDIASFSERKKQ
jgi:hypothetical protein